MKYQILWQANPISCMKTFGKLNCALCMRERVEILRAYYQQEKTKLIKQQNGNFWSLSSQNEVSQVPQGEQDGEKYQY